MRATVLSFNTSHYVSDFELFLKKNEGPLIVWHHLIRNDWEKEFTTYTYCLASTKLTLNDFLSNYCQSEQVVTSTENYLRVLFDSSAKAGWAQCRGWWQRGIWWKHKLWENNSYRLSICACVEDLLWHVASVTGSGSSVLAGRRLWLLWYHNSKPSSIRELTLSSLLFASKLKGGEDWECFMLRFHAVLMLTLLFKSFHWSCSHHIWKYVAIFGRPLKVFCTHLHG